MYMRLVHAKIKPEALSVASQLYNERIASRLQAVPGCLYAGLILSEHHDDECISMTLWEDWEYAESYVQSGLFRELITEAQPYLSDTSEWKVQLSRDLELEYLPVAQEPVVKSYAMTARTGSDVPTDEAGGRMYVRIVSVVVQPRKMGELRKIYTEEIIPALRGTKGCRYAYLTEGIEETHEAISVTIWNSKGDADAYEESGSFAVLLDKVRHTFSEVYQWKMALEREFSGEIVSSADPAVKGYSIVAGKRFR